MLIGGSSTKEIANRLGASPLIIEVHQRPSFREAQGRQPARSHPNLDCGRRQTDGISDRRRMNSCTRNLTTGKGGCVISGRRLVDVARLNESDRMAFERAHEVAQTLASPSDYPASTRGLLTSGARVQTTVSAPGDGTIGKVTLRLIWINASTHVPGALQVV
jgi:hypothetical protein